MGGVKSAVRFRRSSALTVAAVIVMIAGLSLATWAPPYALGLLVIPLAVAVWSWRSGTDVSPDGLTVRATVGKRRIPWTDVDGLVAEPGGQVNARLTSGRAVPLPAVRAQDLPRVVAAAGQEIIAPASDSARGPA